MNILYLIDGFGGGSGEHLAKVANELYNLGYEPAICNLNEYEASSARNLDTRIPIITIRQRKLRRFPFFHVNSFFKIIKVIIQRKPDIVHTYFFWDSVLGLMAGKLTGVSVFVMNKEDDGFQTALYKKLGFKLIHRFFHQIIAVSDSVRIQRSKDEKISAKKIKIIRNGIDLKVFPPEESDRKLIKEFKIEDNEIIVGNVANFNFHIKGQEFLIKAIPEIIFVFPNVKFLFVGGGKLLGKNQELAKLLSVEQKIIFTGFRSDAIKLTGIMDIFVLPSLTEGLSNAVLEAMALSKPVIATNAGGNSELVIDGKTGILVPPRNPSSLGAAIIRLLKDEKLRRSLGKEARKIIEKQFTIQNTAFEYKQTYLGLLDQNKRD